MKWLVFSDSHLGSAVSKRVKDLENLIKAKIECIDTIVIVGDFLDLWRRSFESTYRNKENKCLIDFLLRTVPLSGKKVIYIFGNHEDECVEFLNGEFNLVDFYWNYDFEGIKIIHGHQFDKSYIESRSRLKITSRIFQFFESILGINIRRFGLMLDDLLGFGIYDEFVEDIHNGVTDQYAEDYKAIIIGHTHSDKQKITTKDNFTLYDCGNTYRELDYFIFDNDKLLEMNGVNNV